MATHRVYFTKLSITTCKDISVNQEIQMAIIGLVSAIIGGIIAKLPDILAHVRAQDTKEVDNAQKFIEGAGKLSSSWQTLSDEQQERIALQDGQISSLAQRICDLERERDTLNSQYNEVIARLASLEASEKSLTEQNARLKDEHVRLREENAQLKNSQSALNEKVEELERDNALLRVRVIELESKNTRLKRQTNLQP